VKSVGAAQRCPVAVPKNIARYRGARFSSQQVSNEL
jgi:hypothetical protein